MSTVDGKQGPDSYQLKIDRLGACSLIQDYFRTDLPLVRVLDSLTDGLKPWTPLWARCSENNIGLHVPTAVQLGAALYPCQNATGGDIQDRKGRRYRIYMLVDDLPAYLAAVRLLGNA